MEELIKICFREFCNIAGDSPCGCDGCPYGAYDTENGECYEEYKKHKLKELEQAGVTVQKWIPVTERLPDTNGTFIVTACDEGCSYGEGIWYDTVVVVAEYYKGAWTWDENGTEYDLEGIVTHWMPLPEPPKDNAT